MFFDVAAASSLVSTLALFVSTGPGNNNNVNVGRHLCIASSSFLPQKRITKPFYRSSSALSNDEIGGASSSPDTRANNNPLVGQAVKQEKYLELLKWLESNGATINKCLEIRASSQGEQAGYGVFVNRSVQQDELLFSIPRSLCVTIEKATSSVDDGGEFGDTLQTLIEKAGQGGITVAMAGYLAKEYILLSLEEQDGATEEIQENSNRWGPYMALLPWKRGINNQEHILFWNDDKIEGLLRGSLCYEEAKSLREEVALSIRVLGPLLKSSVRMARGEETKTSRVLERISSMLPWQSDQGADASDALDDKLVADAIKGAFVTLLTRSFQDDDDIGEDGTPAEKLVPLLDLLQHSDAPNVRHNSVSSKTGADDDAAVEVRARLDIDTGSELWNQYRSEEDEAMPYSRFFTRYVKLRRQYNVGVPK